MEGDTNSSSETVALISKGDSKPNKASEKKGIKYPIAALFIIVNEFSLRFPYVATRSVLTLYLRDELLYDENESTMLYHLFILLCYFTSILGAILADTYLGKFKTILYLSIVFACGSVFLGISTIPDTSLQNVSLLGLFIIAIGMGGMKPCVSAFGGEQFVRPEQDRHLEQYFSFVFIASNVGSLLSIFVTPIFRDVKCFGNNSCYPLAFGVPALLTIFAVVVFVSGQRFYKIKDPSGNVVIQVVKCMAHAVAQKCTNKGEKHEHWLDYAGKKFDRQLIQDIKQVLGVLLLYIPIPVFWALFDQQGSRWTFQATRMDGTLGSTSIKPDQLQIINPLLTLVLVPVFESVIYPCFKKCGLLTPLQRIGTGGLLAGLAFIISGIVELNLEPTYARIPETGMSQLNFINTLPCSVIMSYVKDKKTRLIPIEPDGYAIERDLEAVPMEFYVNLENSTCAELYFSSLTWNGVIRGRSAKAYSVVISQRHGKLAVTRLKKEEPLEKSIHSQVRLGVVLLDDDDGESVLERHLEMKSERRSYLFSIPPISMLTPLAQTDVRNIHAGTYQSFIINVNDNRMEDVIGGNITVLPGGCYTVVVRRYSDVRLSKSYNKLLMLIEVTPPSSIHMLWLFPQYFFMVAAEVMLYITGLQFSFTQAPSSMQSVMQATWLLTVTFGNLIVIIVAKTKGNPRQSMEFFLFAGLMVLDMLFFFFLAARYTYVQVPESQYQHDNKKSGDDANATRAS